MSELDSSLNPSSETQLRFAKSQETQLLVDGAMVDPPQWQPGDVVAGMVIEREIGSSSSSTVYCVVDPESGEQFALKIIRTRHEANLTSARLGFNRVRPLSHPSLVRVYEMLMVGPYLACKMELVVGSRLSEVIRRLDRHDHQAVCDLAMKLMSEIGGALWTLHLACCVHRDVKPENVLLDQEGRFRLIDYGLVGECDPDSDPDARRNYIAGTLWYMAPEIFMRQMYPPACDVYSLGCLVLELLSDRCRLPEEQEGRSLGQSVGEIRSFLSKQTPTELADLLVDMLDSEPSNRPTAARLAQLATQSKTPSKDPSRHPSMKLLGHKNDLVVAVQWALATVNHRPRHLHIRGESGIGKSHFIAELKRVIRAQPWFQVFDSACNERMDVSLQAFDAIADAVARRYSRDDRDPIVLKPDHALILRQAFPTLREIVIEPTLLPEEIGEYSTGDLGPVTAAMRLHSLDAAVALLDQMCQYGPVFFIIDDCQWADQDSINALDKLLSHCNGELSIITVGRNLVNQFRMPPDQVIALERLDENTSVEFLGGILSVDESPWDECALSRLAKLGDGNPYRLTQLAACVGGDDANQWQERLRSGPVKIEEIWYRRLDRMNENAAIAIKCLAIAGGPVSTHTLSVVSKLSNRCDAAIHELVQLRLVDFVPGKCTTVQIVHQGIAKCITDRMEPGEFREGHFGWASYLMDCTDNKLHPARIAGHLLHADATDLALPQVILAAAAARNRFALIEAARWHLQAAAILKNDESIDQIRLAIELFESGGQPGEAAAACSLMIEHKSDLALSTNASTIQLVENLLYAGEITAATKVANDFALRQGKTLIDESAESLTRAWWTIDAKVALSLLTINKPSPSFAFQLNRSIVQCRKPGPRRRRWITRWHGLLAAEIDPSVQDEAAAIQANACESIAITQWLGGNYAAAAAHAERAIGRCPESSCIDRFGLANLHATRLWSYFWIGQLQDLVNDSKTLNQKAIDLNDRYASRTLAWGVGATAYLAVDDVRGATIARRQSLSQFGPQRSEWFMAIDGLGPLARYLYQGRRLHAMRFVGSQFKVYGQTLSRVPMLRDLFLYWQSLAMLGHAMDRPVRRDAIIGDVRQLAQGLTKTPMSRMLGTFLGAQCDELVGDAHRCLEGYAIAADAADSLDMIPIRLAAADRIAAVAGEHHASELTLYLSGEGIVKPGSFSRLYTAF